ncbi:hypothetical protein H6P81_004098 [Aristolochia fimbriata]|uniref:Uncharacterized protein n=1 Tax=Aristolochia fimbriata TaxID=158543 RepID=A0AAV7FEF6_ARIFI|nr:hypothetical protein H6P81_004098 [Aristolochia fimbriata]
MGRAPCCEKVGLKKGRWTTEEDDILTKYIQTNGEGSWRSLPMKAGLLRCGKSCRLRWINYLRGDLKRGNITPEEEEVIIKLHSSYGNRWSLIAGHLPGRTDNEIKNYWNSHLSRRIHTVKRLNHDGVPVVLDIGKFVGGPKRRGGRTRRCAAFHKRTAQRTEAPTSTTTITTTKPNQLHKPGSGPNPQATHNDVVVLSDVEKDSGLSSLSHDDFDVMDPGAFWSSNEPTEISRDLSPSRGQSKEREEAAGASDLSSDAFVDDGIFGANYEVSDNAIWGSHRDKEDDLFTFGYEGLNEMVLCPNQVNEISGFWGSDDENGTCFFASSKSGDAIMEGDDNIPCLSYDLLENEFFRFNEVADSVFWSSNGGAESDPNMGFESTGLILSPNDLMESELPPTSDQNEQGRRRCEEDVENGSQGKMNVGCTCTTTDLVLKSGEDHKRENEWSSSGLMADWSWEGFEDKFREMEGGDVWPWLLGSSTADHNGGGLGFEDELTKSYAAWVFPAETNVNI